MEPERFDDVTARYEVEPEPARPSRRRSERGAAAFVAAWIATSALAAGALALTGSDAEKDAVTPLAPVKPAASEVYFHHAGDRERECEERKAAKRRAAGSSSSGLRY